MPATVPPLKSRPKARKAVPSKKKSSTSDCPHCKGGAETFRYFKGAYKFDVDLARKIVGDGRKPIELDAEDVKYSVDISRIYPQHLKHVDTKYPGIIAHVWGPGRDGQWLHGHLLIDGHHRAARCVQLGIPYYVHILTRAESERIVIHGPVSRGRTRPRADAAAASVAVKRR